MTDKEIITALECCFSPYGCGDCPSPDKSCTDEDCAVSLSREAIALITCQKSQIEDLSEALEERIQRIKALEVEVNRLQGHNLRMARKHYDDGVREFAERLKEKDFYWKDDHLCSTKWATERIDTLVKEMKEDSDE